MSSPSPGGPPPLPRCFLFIFLGLPICTWAFVRNGPASFLLPGLHAAHLQQFRAPSQGRRMLAAGAAAAAADEGLVVWSLSDLPAAEETLLRTAVAAADKHKTEDVVCLIRCSGWNVAEEAVEQERLLLHKRRGPLLSGHGLPVPAEACLEPTHVRIFQQKRKRRKDDLLKYEWEMMLIATGLSPIHLDSVAETVIEDLSRMHGPSIYLGRDGRGSSGWVALNFGKLQVHLMTPITRNRYTLELLHKKAPRIDLREILTPRDSFSGFTRP
ncbi:hypothetical protein Esti_000487 [Eimeria stiedai]